MQKVDLCPAGQAKAAVPRRSPFAGDQRERFLARVLIKLHFLKSERLQQAGQGGAGVCIRSFQDSIEQGCLLKLALSLETHFAFQIRIYRHQQASLPGVDASPRIVEAGRE